MSSVYVNFKGVPECRAWRSPCSVRIGDVSLAFDSIAQAAETLEAALSALAVCGERCGICGHYSYASPICEDCEARNNEPQECAEHGSFRGHHPDGCPQCLDEPTHVDELEAL